MRKITCEVCGGTDFQKIDGAFTCQSCGTKYSVEEANKLMKDVVDPNFISKLKIANQQAEKYFSEGPTSVVYGNVQGFDAVVSYYQEAERISAKEPELLLHFVEFYIKGNFEGFKTGHRYLKDAQEFRSFCVARLNEAKGYAQEKQTSQEYMDEIERKISELLALLEEELPKAEERHKLAVKKENRRAVIFAAAFVIAAIGVFVTYLYFSVGGGSGTGSKNSHSSCNYIGEDREYFAGPMVDIYYNYDHPEWGYHTH